VWQASYDHHRYLAAAAVQLFIQNTWPMAYTPSSVLSDGWLPLMMLCAPGKVLRCATGRMVLYLKDINLPQPDKYGTIQLIAFLQQLLTYGGYYDDNLEFIQLDHIQILGSMTPASTVGRHPLSTRFTARMRVACIDYPSLQQLHIIVSACLKPELASSEDPSWGSAQKCASLAAAMLDVYSQVSEAPLVPMHCGIIRPCSACSSLTRGFCAPGARHLPAERPLALPVHTAGSAGVGAWSQGILAAWLRPP
jgi:hypothetical protein